MSLLIGYEVIFSTNHSKCNNMDQFKLAVNSTQLELFYQLRECKTCDLIYSKKFLNSTKNYLLLDSNYGYNFKLVNLLNNQVICSQIHYDQFGECGEYELDTNCKIKTLIEPNNIYIHLFTSLRLLIIFILLTNLAEKYALFGLKQLNSSRLRSLDTFRGLTLFLMIFVNYGSGGYHMLKHAPWHGITLADFVFPWFLFIMGFTVPIVISSSLSKETLRQVFSKILSRSLKLFAIGVMLNSRHGVQLSNLRIFGVLQRISICYLVTASLELFMFKKIYKNNTVSKISLADLVIILIALVWNAIVFYLDVPGCPKGYFGPGGLENNSVYHNCTGGATAYIDKLILGPNHMYSRPTCARIYKTTEPFDPEGILGTFNSVLLTYLGVRAGRVVINRKNELSRLSWWLMWSQACLFIYYLLTGFDTESGLIPVNKNLWTLTYTLITASSSFLMIAFMYYIIDMKQIWSGNPFSYLGTNSILIYIGHCIFNKTLPCQWLVSNTHLAQVLVNLWGSLFWTLVSIYLFIKQIFFNL